MLLSLYGNNGSDCLIHRDMTEVGSEVHVDIYDDRIEFMNPGCWPSCTRIRDYSKLRLPDHSLQESVEALLEW